MIKYMLMFLLTGSLLMAAEGDSLIQFEMEDQFKREYNREQFRGQVAVVIASDREGSEYNREWITALIDSLALNERDGDIAFIGVADVQGVPFFMKAIVRGFMPDEKENWVLLDWDGKFANTYTMKEEHCNILVFDKAGKKHLQTAVTRLDNAVLGQIVEKINQLK